MNVMIPQKIILQAPLLMNPVNPCQNLASEVTDADYINVMKSAARNTIERFCTGNQDFEQIFSLQNTQNITQQICMR